MTKPVAVIGDVVATAAPDHTNPDFAVNWKAGAVTTRSYPHLKSGGAEVIYEASCVFSFTGTNTSTGATLPPGSETVTLTASSTVLQFGADQVLLDGDSTEGSMGGAGQNTLEVVASGPTNTATK